ncbi:hypothetical protein ACIBL3_09920 [Kribbella sp. NPDC050124]|uniref:hypothetical protein n=1 Tax=Kribbella sp. NPDC050124 TaxID=3364114 RepID=UPI00379F8F6F
MGTAEQSEIPPGAENPADAPASQGLDAILVLDAAVGASVLAVAVAQTVGRQVGEVLSPVGRRVGGALSPVAVVILRPPMVAERYQAATWLAELARRGGQGRAELTRQLSAALDRMVPAVAAEVLKRVDVAGMAEGIIAEVDLAEIIRQSTGSVASDTVRGVRLQGISGDEAVGRVVARLRWRRRAAPVMTPATT